MADMPHCRTVSAKVRAHMVLRLLSGAEEAESLCRRFGVCLQCLDDWYRIFVGHGIRGLAVTSGRSADPTPEEALSEEHRELARVVADARLELRILDELAIAARSAPLRD